MFSPCLQNQRAFNKRISEQCISDKRQSLFRFDGIETGLYFCFDPFSLCEPVSTSLENAIVQPAVPNITERALACAVCKQSSRNMAKR
jgi:hypothetical protein